MKTIVTILLFLVSTSILIAGTKNCTTTSDGDFNDASIWSCGSVPDKDDNVTISHIVVLNVSFTGGGKISGDWTIDADKSLLGPTFSLEFGSGTSTINGSMSVYDLSINNGAVLTFSTTSVVNIDNDFTNDNNSDEVSVNTSDFDVGGDLNNGNGGTITGTGSIDVAGNVNNDAGGDIFGCVGDACGCSGCTLVIELTSFSVTNKGGEIVLNWRTESEVNNSHFIIERSKDGNMFTQIDQLYGNGNSMSPIEYEYIDFVNHKESVGSLYYRISDVDYDGTRTYHNIRHVDIGVGEDIVYVGVVGGFLNIQNLGVEDCNYSIYNLGGDSIKTDKLTSNETINYKTDLFKTGVYFIKINNVITKKVFIL